MAAILCIRILPNDHPTDPTLTPMRTKLGDVVEIVDGSHVFSAGERNCGQYRFINITDATPEQLVALVEPMIDPLDPEGVKIIARRKRSFDISVLSGTTWKAKTSATKSQIDLITSVKLAP